MDDDVPLPEELEWLESNCPLPEEEEDYIEEDYYYPQEEEEVEEQDRQPPPPPPPEHQISKTHPPRTATPPSKPTAVVENLINPKKRLWSKGVDSDKPLFLEESVLNAKRNRSVDLETTTGVADEDWLRYSPPPRENVESVVLPAVVIEDKYLSRFASHIEGDSMSVTGPCGDRVYAKINRLETNGAAKKLHLRGHAEGLISEPLSNLMEKLEQDALMKALKESCDDVVGPQSSAVTEHLWVDKYAPSSFTELLSDEQTNREVLLWLKQWDSRVFGSEIRSTTDDVLSSLRRHSSLAHHQKISGANSFRNNREPYSTSKVFKHSDNFNRDNSNFKGIHLSSSKNSKDIGSPEQKVLLLSGPPGLGKTTLAHIAAKHCGYRVVEINASDDRSSATIEAKILDVIQMNSVMADAKPKCLVIDEIDGALGEGKGAVEVILKLVASERMSEVGKENMAQKDQPGKFSSKKGRKTPRLSRPVICICNDLYAPSLRPLRQVAKVHVFTKPTVSRVVSRLKYICNKEAFKASSSALTALAEYTECDIRSCLNTLQFLKKKNETLNMLDISSQVVGRKDMSRSAFDVWKEIFRRRKTKSESKSISSSHNISGDFDYLHSLISNRGEYDLTMDGIHENILQLHYHDPMMQKTVKCLNNLGVSDRLHQYVMRTQQMSLYAYQPSTAIAICRLVSQIKMPNIEWPRSSQRCRTMLMEKRDHLRCWHHKISPSISRHLSSELFVGDVVSPLLYILSPPTLRPVALHLQSEREKYDLDQLVNTMVSLAITYKNIKPETLTNTPRFEAASDTSVLSFDPPVGDFINFKGYISEHSGLSLAMKQVLLHEVEKKKILGESICRSSDSNVGVSTKNKVSLMEEDGKKLPIITNTISEDAENLENNGLNPRQSNASTSIPKPVGFQKSITHSIQPKATSVSKKPSSSSNFFDRFRKLGSNGSQNVDSSLQKSATLERDLRPLLFKFNEGFTNAVKRPVRISELLH